MTIEKAIKDLTDAVDRLNATLAGGYNAAPAAPAEKTEKATKPKAAKPKAAKPKAEPAPEPETLPGEGEDGTVEMCAKLAKDLMTKGQRDTLVTLLGQVDAPNVRAIDPSKYGEFAKAARVALAELEDE